MKTQHKTLKIIIKILTLLLALVGTCFLGYKVGTKTLGSIARYNYHLDDNGNVQSDNLFNVNDYSSKSSIVNLSDNGFYVYKEDSFEFTSCFVVLRDSETNYIRTLYSNNAGYCSFVFDYSYEYYNYYVSFGFNGIADITYKISNIMSYDDYNAISFNYVVNNDYAYLGNIMINRSSLEGNYLPYEPFGTWYTPQTFARSQWQANYSTLLNATYDMTIVKDNTIKPSDEILIQYEEPKQDDTNRFYINLEKDSTTQNWPSAPYDGQWIEQEFTTQYPYISPGYFSINNSMKDLIGNIHISIDIKGHNEPNKRSELFIKLGGNKNGYYYDIDDQINYYVSSAALETIDMYHDLKIEIPQSIIEQLQTREVDSISYSLKGNETLEEFNFYLDTDIFGYNISYEQAYNSGYDLGYNNGYASALNFEWIKTAFSCVDQVLNIKLIGSITLGNIIAIPLIIGVVKFVIGWFK